MNENDIDSDDGFDDELYQDQNEYLNQADIDLSQYQNNPFSREELQNVHLLRNTSYYKNKLLDIVDNSDLYESGKRAWRSVINNYFDQNWMLANLERRHSSWTNKNSSSGVDEVKGAWLTLKLSILKNTVSMCRSDRQSPDYLVIESGLKSHFKAIISRAKGPQRERVLQGRQKVVQENIVKTVEQNQPIAAKKERKKLW